jgi:hypothetical protein
MENRVITRFDIEDFCVRYRGTREFCDSVYFYQFLKFLEDELLVEKVKFANDVLDVPPVQTFIKIYRDFFTEQLKKEPLGKMRASDKQGLGACFGYLYRFIYNENYQPVQAWVGDVKPGGTGIKTASYFMKGVS